MTRFLRNKATRGILAGVARRRRTAGRADRVGRPGSARPGGRAEGRCQDHDDDARRRPAASPRRGTSPPARARRSGRPVPPRPSPTWAGAATACRCTPTTAATGSTRPRSSPSRMRCTRSCSRSATSTSTSTRPGTAASTGTAGRCRARSCTRTGCQAVINHIHANGQKVGIYSIPGISQGRAGRQPARLRPSGLYDG